MAEKDLSGKRIEDYNDVFADIYNTLLFGREYLNPDQLKAGPTESVYKTDTKNLNEQRRDILKKYQNAVHLVVSSFGIENQATVDKCMPVRVMGYDAGTYRQQITDREGKLSPVVTIVLNMTDKKWDAAKNICEMMDIDPEMAGYVQDYKIHVFDIAFLEDGVIERFTSDFREIARFFKRKRLGENPLASENELEHPYAIMEFISVFTQDTSYMETVGYLENISRRGGAVTMCAVADALKTEGRQEGIREGRREGIREGRREGKLEGKVELLVEMNFTVAEISEKLRLSEEETEKVIKKIGCSL